MNLRYVNLQADFSTVLVLTNSQELFGNLQALAGALRIPKESAPLLIERFKKTRYNPFAENERKRGFVRCTREA